MKYLLISLLIIALSSCQSKKNNVTKIVFNVDVSEIQGDIEDISTLGISGYRPHLLPRRIIPLIAQGNGIYSAEMSFDREFVGDTIIYWYSHDLIQLENLPYGQMGYRKVVIGPKDKNLPIVKWGEIDVTKDMKISSPRMIVRQPDKEDEEAYFSQPFIGITTDGQLQKKLYSIHETGLSTKSIRTAVLKFSDSLNQEQKDKTMFPIDAREWQRWSNTDFYRRKGICLCDLNEVQKELAIEILKESLSPVGFDKSNNIMKMEAYLGRIMNKTERFNSDLYWLTIMGNPSETEPWGWQLEGHHLVINYFVLKDQVVMTPTFMGSEPVYIQNGEGEGIRTFEREEKLGLELYNSLNEEQRQSATLHDKKEFNFIQTQSYSDNRIIPYSGIRTTELDAQQTQRLLSLIYEYVGNIKEGHAALKMEEVKRHLDETYFSWIGIPHEDHPFYYRIHSPVILIEFDHQKPVAPSGDKPSRQHIHTVVRTPNGNDYGKDLLRQHLEQHHHHK
jgi:hypothetical protein